MNKTKEYIEELEKGMKGLDWILKKSVKTSITKTENNVGITFDIRLDKHIGLEVVLYKYYDEDPFYISYQLHSFTSSTWFVHQKKYYDEKDEVLSEIERRTDLFIKKHCDLRLLNLYKDMVIHM